MTCNRCLWTYIPEDVVYPVSLPTAVSDSTCSKSEVYIYLANSAKWMTAFWLCKEFSQVFKYCIQIYIYIYTCVYMYTNIYIGYMPAHTE